ncbi:ScbA/BarX family gamma-butyrolactone biosynthesis protein [Streptomyces huasconensis]|uniref:ScbA/BarX family gamma-butyrolactone biosynthesis protein n=1 Tax=Streptomyces huasconensis TaxID=1854574 RepID=A0ABV3LR95_9ACTN
MPRSLVHRRANSEVFLTDWARAGTDRFSLRGQWPRGHAFYRLDEDTHFDPLLAAETLRQAALLIAHACYGVPRSSCFLMSELEFRLDEEGLRMEGAPADLELPARCSRIEWRDGQVAAFHISMRFVRDGTPIGTASGVTRVTPPAVYSRLRWAGRTPTTVADGFVPAEPVAPWRVGKRLPDDVVLGEPTSEGAWPLRVLLDHPTLFDHPLDHVPGMLSMEAVRQALHALSGSRRVLPVALRMSFPAFADLDVPCLVRAERRGAAEVSVVVEQRGRTVATGVVSGHRLSRPAAAPRRLRALSAQAEAPDMLCSARV